MMKSFDINRNANHYLVVYIIEIACHHANNNSNKSPLFPSSVFERVITVQNNIFLPEKAFCNRLENFLCNVFGRLNFCQNTALARSFVISKICF